MKKILASLITMLLIGAGLFISYKRPAKLSDQPESAVWRMLAESRAANLQGYLDCFAGNLRTQMELAFGGMTPEQSTGFLRESASRIKGVALHDLRKSSENEATVVADYVYQDRNDRQRLTLGFDGKSWRIVSAESSKRIQPLVPYGQAVYE